MVELMAEMIASSLFYWPVNKFAKNGVTDANKSRRPLHSCFIAVLLFDIKIFLLEIFFNPFNITNKKISTSKRRVRGPLLLASAMPVLANFLTGQ